MSNPSFSNIDLWLFELNEGNLTPQQVEQLELFLLQHPELDVDKDVWEMARINKQAVAYDGAEGLKKRRPVAWYYGSAAAVVASAVIGWFLLAPEATTDNQTAKNSSLDQVQRRLIQMAAVGPRTNMNQEAQSNIVDPMNVDNNATLVNANRIQNSSFSSGSDNIPSTVSASNAPVLQDPINDSDISYTSGTSMASATGVSLPNTFVYTNQPVVNNLVGQLNNATVEPVFHLTAELPLNEIETLDITQEAELANAMNVTAEGDYTDNELRALHIRRKSEKTSSKDYKTTMRSRLKVISHKVQRMIDNPIALKNFRDPAYHVPGMLPNDVNMSSAGTLLSTRVQASSRVQWLGQENQQLMSQIAVDGYAYGLRGGVGVQVNHFMYRDGAMNIGSAAITYSPKMSINQTISIEPSLRFKMGNKAFSKSKLAGIEQLEVERGNAHDFYPGDDELIGRDQWYKDLGAGLMVNTEWFFVGAQVDNLFRHKDNVYENNFENPRRAGYHFVGTVGTDWVSQKKTLAFSPYLVYQNYEKLSEAWLGTNFRWHWFTVGGAVSSNLEPAASIGVKFEQFAFTYNADYVKSEMTGNSALSHQVTLRFVSKPSRFGKRILNL